MTEPTPEMVAAATHQVRMILMGTGSLTLSQVDEYQRPLALAVLAAVLAADPLRADTRARMADKDRP